MESVEPEAFAAFVGKWLAREPEMTIAEVFCPRPGRARYRAWGALLHELRTTAFELSDARVTEVKTGWWAEELMAMGQGRHRHPLTEVLVESAAPWSALGRALLELTDAGQRYGTTSEVIGSLMPVANSVVAVEAALFETAASETGARALVVHWLLQRLPRGLAAEDQARIPMHLFARHGVTAAQLAGGQGEPMLRDWAGELLTALPLNTAGTCAFRRSRTSFDRASLRRLAAGRGFTDPPALATLWRAWRAARPL